MLTLIIFIAILAVLVLSHEFGHFIAARKNGIKVEEFGFGFPPRIFGVQVFRKSGLKKIAETEEVKIEISEKNLPSGQEVIEEKITDKIQEIDIPITEKKWRFVWGNKQINNVETPRNGGASLPNVKEGTVYSLNWIPLGGFVKIKGEDGENKDPDSFASKKPWQKAIVLSAGVIMNVILAGVLLSLGFMVGLPQPVDQMEDLSVVKNRRLEITQLLPGKPAEAAGLQVGDAIIRLDNLNEPRLAQMQAYVDAHKNDIIKVVVKRGNEAIEKDIKPIVYPDTGKGGLGVAIVEVGTVVYPWYQAIYYGFLNSVLYIKEIFISFYYLIKGLIIGAGVGGAVTGPVGIAVMTGQVARLGFAYLVQFMAILSLNLAVLNILPIPALDGGRLLFIVISKIIRRPVNQKHEQLAHTIGFALLMLLVVVVTVNDLGNFKGFFVNLWNRVF